MLLDFTDLGYWLPAKAVKVSGKKKNAQVRRQQILQGFNGRFESGRVVAILGPSGSGKSTFMNILAGRVSQQSVSGSTISGQVSISGLIIDPVKMQKVFAYVMSDDALYATMTPKEAFNFAGKMRLPPPELMRLYRSSRSYDDTEEESAAVDNTADKVELMLNVLGLKKCAETYIGNHLIKGISSGERKRTAVGVELVSESRIIFLDEPTSGLDSYTAYSLVKGPLRDLATGVLRSESGNIERKASSNFDKIVVCTIHQPSSETFLEFDDVMLLSPDGRCIYFGPSPRRSQEMWDFFTFAGYPCPENYNLADHALTLMQTLPREELDRLEEIQLSSRGQQFSEAIAKGRRTSGGKLPQIYMASFTQQIACLCKREALNFIRDVVTLRARFGVSLLLSLLFGSIFFDVGESTRVNSEVYAAHGGSPVGVIDPSHFGGLAMLAVNSMMSISQTIILVLPLERPVLLREYTSGTYYIPSYMLSKISVEFVVSFMQTLLQYTIISRMMGFHGNYLEELLASYLVGIAGASIAVALVSFVKDSKKAIEIFPMFFMPQIMFSGIFVPTEQIPEVLRWIQYLCPLKYCVNLLLIIEFADTNTPGADFLLQQNDAVAEDKIIYFLILIGLIVLFRTLSCFGLWKNAKTVV